MTTTDAETAADPQPGDLWAEMVTCGTCLVVGRDGDRVRVCWDKRYDEGGYVFVNPQWTTVSEFERRLRYATRDGYWPHIHSRGNDVSSYEG